MGEFLDHFQKTGRIKNQGFLAGQLGVDNKTISNWANGQTEISVLVRFTLAHLYDVPFEWWDQEGVPIQEAIGKRAKSEKDDLATADILWVPRIDASLRVDKQGQEIEISSLSLSAAEQVPIPREYVKGRGPYCILRIEGDSMEPRFHNGDLVLVNLQQKPASDLKGKPVAAWVPDLGGGLIKILKEDQLGTWILRSVNDNYPDISVPHEQAHFHVFEVEAVVYQKIKAA